MKEDLEKQVKLQRFNKEEEKRKELQYMKMVKEQGEIQ